MSDKMEPCALCGFPPKIWANTRWGCSNLDCVASGPRKDKSGEGWNRLMRREPVKVEPKPGTVRVRIPVSIYANGSMSISWARYSDGEQSPSGHSNLPVVTITADIPIPQTAEVVGKVEVDD
jgi:hypothetical protein